MTDPLSYDSFYDPHLQTYFGNKNVRKHLRKVGLINRHGDIIPYKEYQATINERSRQEHVKALLSHGVVQRVMELEKIRQANIRNEFEVINKRIRVEHIKESRQQYKELHSKDFILLNRPKTTHHQTQIEMNDEYKSNPTRLLSSRPIRHKSPKIIQKSSINSKDRCQITMIYLGGQTNVDLEQSNTSQIIIMQQHCGGENIIIFKNNLKQNEKFQFESHRHNEYPFALSLYVNGLIDCRISVCCEYKHKLGSFAILNVQGSQPCQTCRFNEYMAKSPLFKRKSSEQNSIISNTTKSRISDETNTHQLLRTPIPHDENENENKNDEYEEAKEIYKIYIEKLENSKNWKEKGCLENQLGNICKEGLGDYEKALNHYLTSIEIYCQYISPLDIKLRNIYLSIAHLLLLQNNSNENLSIEYFKRILQIDNLFNYENEFNLINDHNYLGLLYQNKDNYQQALFHFNQSLKYYFIINKNNYSKDNQYNYINNQTIYDKKSFISLSIDKIPHLSEIYFNLSTTYENLQQKQNALKYVQKAIQTANYDQNKIQIYQNYFNKLLQN